MTIGVAKCSLSGSSPGTPVTGDITGIDLVVGGTVAVDQGRETEVGGLIENISNGVGHIDSLPRAAVILGLGIAAAALGFRRIKPTATGVLTLEGLEAIGGIVAWALLPSALDSKLIDPSVTSDTVRFEHTITMWRIGGDLMFAGFLWVFVASHLNALGPRRNPLDFLPGSLVRAPVLSRRIWSTSASLPPGTTTPSTTQPSASFSSASTSSLSRSSGFQGNAPQSAKAAPFLPDDSTRIQRVAHTPITAHVRYLGTGPRGGA